MHVAFPGFHTCYLMLFNNSKPLARLSHESGNLIIRGTEFNYEMPNQVGQDVRSGCVLRLLV
jgi:hypothetical protein